MTEHFPKSYRLEDGASITLTQMARTDLDALSKFVNRLPKHDLLYLQHDITQPSVLEAWMDNLDSGLAKSICAYDPAALVGYVSVQLPSPPPTTEAGEIRVNVSQGYRSRGLGKLLTDEMMALCHSLGITNLTARMTTDQYGAKSAFKRLGFQEEEVLKNHVKDLNGQPRDLVVMSHRLAS